MNNIDTLPEQKPIVLVYSHSEDYAQRIVQRLSAFDNTYSIVASNNSNLTSLNKQNHSFDLLIYLAENKTDVIEIDEPLQALAKNTPIIYVIEGLSSTKATRLMRNGIEAVVEPDAIEDLQLIIEEIIDTKHGIRHCSSNQYQAIIDAVQGIIIVDHRGIIVETNAKLAEIFGYEQQELLQQHIKILLVGEEKHTHEYNFDKYFSTLSTIEFEHRDDCAGRHKLGHIVPLDIAMVLLPDNNQIMALVTDISLRREAEQLLKDTNQALEQRVAARTQELENVKRQIEAIFNNSGDAIILLDTQMRIQQANYACKWIFNIDINNVYNKQLFEFIHKEDVPHVIEALSQTQSKKVSSYSEIRFAKGDNAYVETEMSISPVLDPRADTRTFVCIIRDISERKKARKELEKREKMLRILAENYPAYLSMINPDLTVGFTAGMEFKKLGLDPDTFIGMRIQDILDDEVADFIIERYSSAFGGLEQSFELFTNGQYQLYHVVPLLDDDGKINNILAVVENITRRKLSELAVEESEERYRLLAENVTDMISRHSNDGIYIYATPSSTTITGYLPEELVGHSVYDFFHPEDLEAVKNSRQAIIGGNVVYTMQYRLRRKDGNYVWVETTNHMIMDDNDNLVEIVAVTRDITERKETENVLKETLIKEKELSVLKSRIVSVASHEFRTPLASILAITETLSRFRNRMDEEKIDDRLEKIITQVNRMKEITQDMLHFTRLQVQEYQLNLQKYNVNDFIAGIIDGFNQQDQFKGRVSSTSKLTDAEFVFDEELMRQLINKLIRNALKYSKADSPVKVELATEDSTLLIHVIDQGIGISPEDQQHLTRAFYRATTPAGIPENGLGLSIAKQIATLHGGDLNIKSEENKGSTFTVVIPFIDKVGIRNGHNIDH